nr:hypothetical protein CFP56_49624 [Quercus suber]
MGNYFQPQFIPFPYLGFHQNQSNPLQLQQAFVEMAVPQVNKKLLDELEAMGYPRPRATRALHFSVCFCR